MVLLVVTLARATAMWLAQAAYLFQTYMMCTAPLAQWGRLPPPQYTNSKRQLGAGISQGPTVLSMESLSLDVTNHQTSSTKFISVRCLERRSGLMALKM